MKKYEWMSTALWGHKTSWPGICKRYIKDGSETNSTVCPYILCEMIEEADNCVQPRAVKTGDVTPKMLEIAGEIPHSRQRLKSKAKKYGGYTLEELREYSCTSARLSWELNHPQMSIDAATAFRALAMAMNEILLDLPKMEIKP